jgi:plastocyanin
MNRRTPVALAAVAALGAAVLTGAPADAASRHKPKPKPNTIETHGNLKVKINGYIQDAQRFFPGTISVKSGTTVKLINKSKGGAPHSLSLLKRSALPRTGDDIEQCPACGPLLAAHQANPDTGEVGVPLYDTGAPGFDTMGDTTTAGDSIFLPPQGKVSFKVTAKKGTTLTFFCAVHPWMQGTIKVK